MTSKEGRQLKWLVCVVTLCILTAEKANRRAEPQHLPGDRRGPGKQAVPELGPDMCQPLP